MIDIAVLNEAKNKREVNIVKEISQYMTWQDPINLERDVENCPKFPVMCSRTVCSRLC